MTIKELKDFIYRSFYRQIGFPKGSSYYLFLLATKLVEKPNANNVKKYY